jgi:hypothetical protein
LPQTLTGIALGVQEPVFMRIDFAPIAAPIVVDQQVVLPVADRQPVVQHDEIVVVGPHGVGEHGAHLLRPVVVAGDELQHGF